MTRNRIIQFCQQIRTFTKSLSEHPLERPSVKSAEVKAMNATYLVSFLRSKPEKISPAQVTRIIAVIEENCRTIEF
jgi:hypothetical protein